MFHLLVIMRILWNESGVLGMLSWFDWQSCRFRYKIASEHSGHCCNSVINIYIYSVFHIALYQRVQYCILNTLMMTSQCENNDFGVKSRKMCCLIVGLGDEQLIDLFCIKKKWLPFYSVWKFRLNNRRASWIFFMLLIFFFN